MDKNNENMDSTKKHSYRCILDTVPIPIFEVDEGLVIRLANREAQQRWPTIEEGKSHFCRALRCEEEAPGHSIVAKTFQLKKSLTVEVETKAGEIFEIKTNYVEDIKQGSTRVVAHILDITAHKKVAAALVESEEKYRTIFELSPETIVLLDKDGTLADVNKRLSDTLGYKKDALLGKHFSELPFFTGENKGKAKQAFKDRMQGKDVPPYDLEFESKSGKKIVGRIVSTLVKDNAGAITHDLVIMSDITPRKQAEDELKRHRDHLEELVNERTAELSKANKGLKAEIGQRKRTEEQIKAALEEKEVLIKEIHHRVKNNLQLINSLLNLQARRIPDEKNRSPFEECKNRISSIALVHEKIYESNDLAKINFGEYLHTLTTQFFTSYPGRLSHIDLKIDVQNILLPVNQAIPCALIINELLSNSIKYAFPPKQKKSGKILIQFKSGENNTATLTAADNGVGLPGGFDIDTSDTLGMHIISALVRQLHASIRVEGKKGTTFTVRFQIHREKE